MRQGYCYTCLAIGGGSVGSLRLLEKFPFDCVANLHKFPRRTQLHFLRNGRVLRSQEREVLRKEIAGGGGVKGVK